MEVLLASFLPPSESTIQCYDIYSGNRLELLSLRPVFKDIEKNQNQVWTQYLGNCQKFKDAIYFAKDVAKVMKRESSKLRQQLNLAMIPVVQNSLGTPNLEALKPDLNKGNIDLAYPYQCWLFWDDEYFSRCGQKFSS